MSQSAEKEAFIPIENAGKSSSYARIPVWISIIVVIGILLILSGAVISKVNPGMLTNGGRATEEVRVYADYLFSRNLALAIMLIFLLVIKARRMLAGFMVLIALIQILDVINDLMRGAFLLAPGLLVFGIVFAIGAWKLFGRGFWRIATWQE